MPSSAGALFDDDPFDRDDPQDIDVDDADLSDDVEPTQVVPCPSCGRSVYEGADRCPQCGDWIIPKHVERGPKKLIWIIAAVLALLAMLALST